MANSFGSLLAAKAARMETASQAETLLKSVEELRQKEKAAAKERRRKEHEKRVAEAKRQWAIVAYDEFGTIVEICLLRPLNTTRRWQVFIRQTIVEWNENGWDWDRIPAEEARLGKSVQALLVKAA